MDLLPYGDLYELKTNLDEIVTRTLFKQIAEVIAHLHEAGIAHRDIKLDNIAVNKKCQPVLIDFGYARQCSSLQSDQKGTPGYMAPESYDQQGIDPFKVDIWALAITLFHLIKRGQPAFGMDGESGIPYDAVYDDGEQL